MPFPASGGAKPFISTCIRFAYHGCANRPFFHIVVMNRQSPRQGLVIEQLGTFDPLVNQYGEKLCSLNIERLIYWIGNGSHISMPCSELLGLAGILPIHPKTYIKAWRRRKRCAEEASAKQEDIST